MKERALGHLAMGWWGSGFRKHVLKEVKPELNVEGRNGVNQTKRSRNYHLQKCRAGGLGFCRAALSGHRVRQEGRATKKGRLRKAL